jgi:hypothetical protein
MARTTVRVPGATEETAPPPGRRPKRGKAPTKLERLEKLRERILTLGQDLLAEGFGAQVPPPGPIRLTAEAIHDPKTGGWIGHVEEPLGTYIQRVSIVGNFSQRPPFDHITDPIYRRLIRDFLTGAVMPEAKVAVLSSTGSETKVAALDAPDIRYSMIDGLQRLYCYYNPSCHLLKSMGFCLTLTVKSPISPQEEPAHGRQNYRDVLSV